MLNDEVCSKIYIYDCEVKEYHKCVILNENEDKNELTIEQCDEELILTDLKAYDINFDLTKINSYNESSYNLVDYILDSLDKFNNYLYEKVSISDNIC